ncbi:uncharacterized protein LOC131688010 [Topomyia yanbarensis]|uniref:uncharacterized protein LOC131688010 n=1 Tax=Topomyia yanbarensis TaxID=2498891 RepID=UPI00273BB872|nr:uncharacterized protein LOC131688010 [Topomyia yanbarensis]
MSHLVWRFETGTTNEDFQQLKQKMYKVVLEADWSTVIGSGFLVCFLPKTGLEQANLWFIMLVQYFEMEFVEEDLAEESLQVANYVSNLCTFLNVCYLKQYDTPAFVMKYVLEGIARFQNHPLIRTNQIIQNKQLRQLLPTNNMETVYGLLPACIPRLKWFQQSCLPWKAEFIYRQRLDALQERLLPMHTITGDLLALFPMQLLFTVLNSNNSNQMSQTNASMILSRVSLPEPLLCKLIDDRLTKKGCKKWPQYLRAIYGSLHELSDESRFKLFAFISGIFKSNQLDAAHCVLPIDILTRLFIIEQRADGDIEDK